MSTWLVAIGVLIQAGAVVFAALYARGQLSEFRKSREETTRPFVVIDLETWQTIATLKIKNIGQSIAKNVTFRFSPALMSTFDGRMGSGNYHLSQIEVFAKGIASLPPGRELSTLFDQVPQRLGAGLPNRYEVDISFEAPNGKHYTDRQVLSLETHVGLTRVERKGLHELTKSLDQLVREIKRWGASGGGLRVANDEDIRRRFDRFNETIEAEAEAASELTEDAGEDDAGEKAA